MVKAEADGNKRIGACPTALLSARGEGHYSCVKLLIVTGADVNETPKEGFTALITAERPIPGSVRCIKASLQAGAFFLGKGLNGSCKLNSLILAQLFSCDITNHSGGCHCGCRRHRCCGQDVRYELKFVHNIDNIQTPVS